MPFGWNRKTCAFCDGRIKIEVAAPPERQAQAKPPKTAPAQTIWGDAFDETRWQKKKFVPAQRITGREDEEESYFNGTAAVSGFGFAKRAVLPMFLLNVVSLGFVSLFWLWHHLLAMNDRVRPEEKIRNNAVYIWAFAYAAGLLFALWAAWDFSSISNAPAANLLTRAYQPALSAMYLLFCAVVNRHFLFWIREAMIEELDRQQTLSTARYDNRTFASSPLLIWFVGVPYVQFHINRMIARNRVAHRDQSKRSSA